jgi:N-methylhydantoinase A
VTVHLCTDVGGTFTDLYARIDGDARSFKTPTTPGDLTAGLFDAIEKAADAYGRSVEELLADTERFIHGTTIATNAIIEGTVADTALVCTEGHRDVLTIREGFREDPYDWSEDYPEPYVPRSLTFGVPERIDAEGEIVDPLDEAAARRTVEEIRRADVDSVAVSLLWAHQNPAHERRLAELLDELAPELHYSLSSVVAPMIREYRRTSATAIDASLHDVVGEYLLSLRGELSAAGFEGEPLVITANGGVMSVEEAARVPIWLVDAGPTMFPVAAREAVSADLGVEDVIALDMGGTSLDMAVVRDGTVARTREASVEGEHMLGIEKVDVRSIGSGGGSVAWVDEGGLLHVGPESAGADPGPACYDRGGERPTVTDAALELGYLDPGYFLGGEMDVDPAAAAHALESDVGDPLGVDATAAAWAVYATANQVISNGIRERTIERGVDPRNYVVSGGGGALGTHVVPVARELGVEELLVPRQAGVVSAVGGLTSDVRRDFSESQVTTAAGFDREGVNGTLADLESRATAFFERAGIGDERRSLSMFASARYPHQVWELEVELPAMRLGGGEVDRLVDRFHEVHERTYGFAVEEQDVEFLHWRVEATGETDTASVSPPALETGGDGESEPRGEREAYVDGTFRPCPSYRATDLAPGETLSGPAFVDSATTTLVLPPETDLTVTDRGNYHVRT